MIGRFLSAFRRCLSPTCREAAGLISEASGRTLSLPERIGLGMHLLICRACRAYRNSIRVLGELMQNLSHAPPLPDSEAMPDTAKARILRTIEGR